MNATHPSWFSLHTHTLLPCRNWKGTFFCFCDILLCRSQWPGGLRRRSSVARLLRLWVRIPPAAWMPFCCDCRVLSGRGLCDELITRAAKSYRLWCVVCDIETSWMRRPWPTGGCCAKNKKIYFVTPKCKISSSGWCHLCCGVAEESAAGLLN